MLIPDAACNLRGIQWMGFTIDDLFYKHRAPLGQNLWAKLDIEPWPVPVRVTFCG